MFSKIFKYIKLDSFLLIKLDWEGSLPHTETSNKRLSCKCNFSRNINGSRGKHYPFALKILHLSLTPKKGNGWPTLIKNPEQKSKERGKVENFLPKKCETPEDRTGETQIQYTASHPLLDNKGGRGRDVERCENWGWQTPYQTPGITVHT